MTIYRFKGLLTRGRCQHKTDAETGLWIALAKPIDGTETCIVRCCQCKLTFEELKKEVKIAYFNDTCLLCLQCDDASNY